MDNHRDRVNQLGEAQINLAERKSELAEAQAHTGKRLKTPIGIVKEGRVGGNGSLPSR